MIFRISVLVVASVSAIALTHVNNHCFRRRNSSTKSPKNDGSGFQHKQNQQKEDKFEDSNVEESRQEEEVTSNCSKNKHQLKENGPENSVCLSFESRIDDEKWNNLTEVELLKNAVKEMEQRRVILEVKLLELISLREQKSDITRLQNHLETKTAEINKLNFTLDALQEDGKKLHEEIKQNFLAEMQLDIERKRMLEMQAKSSIDASQTKGQLMMLKEKVCGLQMEETPGRDAKVENKLRGMKDLEMEVVVTKRRNKELQFRKRELGFKLAAAQARITALSNMTKSQIVTELEAEKRSLRLANEELSKQVDRLQKDRFGMVEELIYQRRLNICLRFEFQNFQNQQWKTSKSYHNENFSSEFHKKSKQPSLDSSLDRNFPHASSSESDENIDSSSSSQNSVHKKFSLIRKMKRWGRSKDQTGPISSTGSSPRIRTGLIRRFSMSTVPSNTSMLMNEGDRRLITPSRRENVQESLETTSLNFHRMRRVSFDDSVKTVPSTFDQAMPKSVQGVLKTEQTSTKKVLKNGTVGNTASSYKSTVRLEEEKSEFSSPTTPTLSATKAESSSNLSNQDIHNENEDEETQEVPNVLPSEKQIGAKELVHLVAVFFFFFFFLVLLVCFIAGA